jgi:hypothetical protein
MSLDLLLRNLSPPPSPIEAPSAEDWNIVENSLRGLPTDYKAFVEKFGTGAINQFIWVLNPTAANPYLNLLKQMAPILGALKEVRDNGEPSPYALYPEPSGLLPFAKTDNGDAMFWLTQGDPNEWPVVVNAARDASYEKFDCNMTRFLAGILTRNLRCSIFHDSFPDGEPTFDPANE